MDGTRHFRENPGRNHWRGRNDDKYRQLEVTVKIEMQKDK